MKENENMMEEEFPEELHCSGWLSFWQEEDGVGVVELILILVVLISLVLIFKTQLTTLVKNIFSQITSKSNEVY